MNGKIIKQAGAVVGIIIVGTGAWIGLDAHWTTREYHDVCLAAQEKVNQEVTRTLQMQQMQIKKNDERSQLFYLQKMEIELMGAVSAHPNDQNLKKSLEGVRKQREELERRLNGN